MASKHDKTLRAIFATPTRANIKWRDIEAMIRANGGTIREGRGSRVGIEINGLRAVMHRPHPSPDTDKGAVDALRVFLERADVAPKQS